MRNIVDFHHHWMPREHVDQPHRFLRPGETIQEVELSDGQVSKRINRDGMAAITITDARHVIEERLRLMDEAHVQTAIFTLATWISFMEDLRTCEYVNEEMAKAITNHPGRLVGAAHVPLSPSDAAAKELEHCVRDRGFKAFSTITNVRGMFPDHKLYYPLYEVAEAYGVPVIVHAAACPADEASLRDYDLSRTIGREVDHTIAVARIFRSEIPDRFPNLKFIHCHMGGTFFMSTFRYSRGGGEGLESRTIDVNHPEPTYEEYLRRMRNMYFNTTFWDRKALQYAIEVYGADHVVFGSDFPIRTSIMKDIAQTLDALGLSEEEKDQIAFKNAERIFGGAPVGSQ